MGLSIAAFDIETTCLEASYGRPLCACFKYQDRDKVVTFKSPSLKDEPKFLADVAAEIARINILVTWNGKLFDVPFIDARLLAAGLPPLVKPMHIDLMWIHKARCRSRGHSLDGVAKDLSCKQQKYQVPAQVWQQAMDTGDERISKPALDLIVKHCEFDVRTTEEVLDRMKFLLVNITR